MRPLIRALLFLAVLWLPTAASADSTCGNSMNPNTVCGRLGAGQQGSPQAIPFATLLAILSQTNTASNSLAITNGNAPAGPFLELYASPTGSDTNNNCMNSGAPCTLQGACRTRSQIATYLVSSVTINVGPGTYSAVDGFHALCSIVGNFGGSSSALTNVTGDIVTPSNVILSIPDNGKGIFTKDAGETNVQGFQFNGGNNAVGISGAQFSIADYGNVIWGTFGTSGIHVNLSLNSSASLIAPETITAGAVAHWNVSSGANFAAASSTTFSGSPAWSTAFLLGTNPATINLGSWTFSGATTGPRAVLTGPGYLITPSSAACNSALPGNAACQILAGFQDSAGDPLTAPQPAPTTVFASLPTGVAGMYAYISDGKASNCGDSACTAWGTTVTGGTGSLKLFVWYNGTNWTLAGK